MHTFTNKDVKVLIIFQKLLPQVSKLCQSEQYVLDKHNHTCQHLKHCKLQYPMDNQLPEKKNKKLSWLEQNKKKKQLFKDNNWNDKSLHHNISRLVLRQCSSALSNNTPKWILTFATSKTAYGIAATQVNIKFTWSEITNTTDVKLKCMHSVMLWIMTIQKAIWLTTAFRIDSSIGKDQRKNRKNKFWFSNWKFPNPLDYY